MTVWKLSPWWFEIQTCTLQSGYISEFFREAGGASAALKLPVSVEYINIRYFSSLLSLQLWILLWWQPSSPPFAILKGFMLHSQISEKIRLVLAWLLVYEKSTGSRFATFTVYFLWGKCIKVFTACLNKLWKQHDTPNEFGRLSAASSRICPHLYVKRAWRYLLVVQLLSVKKSSLPTFFLHSHILWYILYLTSAAATWISRQLPFLYDT